MLCKAYTVYQLGWLSVVCAHVCALCISRCHSVCLSVSSNQLSQHDEKERLMEADSANSDLHICVVCMKSLMNTTVRARALCILYIRT